MSPDELYHVTLSTRPFAAMYCANTFSFLSVAKSSDGRIDENWHTPLSLIAFHDGLEYRNADGRTSTSDDLSASERNLASVCQ